MKKVLVFQHVAHEVLGTLDPQLKEAGIRIRYINFGRDAGLKPSLKGYDGLIILGGPMNVDQTTEYPNLAFEIEAAREAVAKGMPVLGICLGSQILARALGAHVTKNPEKEIGWYAVRPTDAGGRDPLIRHLGDSAEVFQWHGDTFAIPSGAKHLAVSAACPHQAFVYGDRAYGFQFHLEVDEPMIRRWLTVPYNKKDIAATRGRIVPEKIRRDTEVHITELAKLSRKVFGGYIEKFGRPKKFLQLSSR